MLTETLGTPTRLRSRLHRAFTWANLLWAMIILGALASYNGSKYVPPIEASEIHPARAPSDSSGDVALAMCHLDPAYNRATRENFAPQAARQAETRSEVAHARRVNLGNVPAANECDIIVEPRQGMAAAPTSARPSKFANKKAQYDRLVDEIALKYGLESALLHAVISVESRYRATAVSSKGAAGLMQIMPELAKQYGVTDSLDPAQNLHAGAKHLQYLLKKFNNDMSLALAAYNAGEASVIRHGNRIPPFPETTSYVPQVLGFYHEYRSTVF